MANAKDADIISVLCVVFIVITQNVDMLMSVWYNIFIKKIVGDKMLIESVVKIEADRNENMIRQYEALIEKMPRGSLICRKKEYYYLKYREAGKIQDKYIGKDPDLVADIRAKLEQRKHYTEMLVALRQEQKVIQKILEGFV